MEVYPLLKKVRDEKPLVHHITNWVTIYDCANIVKVFGASPVMAHAREEVADMVKLASSLVLNIGTLTSDIVESMIIAGKAANAKNIPVVLDVCGAGATPFRDSTCDRILDSVRVSIIKGNVSEIARAAGENITTKGVDAVSVSGDNLAIAKQLAARRATVVVITGKTDIITDSHNSYLVKNGCEMMSQIVGTGCMAASVIGAFAAVSSDLLVASAAGLCCFEIAAEIALVASQGPGSFKENLFDAVYHLDEEVVELRKKIEKP
jgi:hydroxyethylthiazole kinase